MTGRQLILDLPLPERLSRADYLVTPANAGPHDLVMRYPHWPAPVLALTGPEGSGKTHLGEIWCQQAGAGRLRAGFDLSRLSAGFAVLVDDLPDAMSARELFHLINLAREHRGHALLVSRSHPAGWPALFPDLVSRLKTVPVIELSHPDDTLLRLVLAKQFDDRQILVDEAILTYLVNRMPRSLGAARWIAQAIDRRSLEQKREITRGLAAEVLAEISEPGLFGAGSGESGEGI